jgi:hypothetical protein
MVLVIRSHKGRNHILAKERNGVGTVDDRRRATELVGFGPSRIAGITCSSITQRMSITHCSARSARFLACVRSVSRRRTLSSFSRRMRPPFGSMVVRTWSVIRFPVQGAPDGVIEGGRPLWHGSLAGQRRWLLDQIGQGFSRLVEPACAALAIASEASAGCVSKCLWECAWPAIPGPGNRLDGGQIHGGWRRAGRRCGQHD